MILFAAYDKAVLQNLAPKEKMSNRLFLLKSRGEAAYEDISHWQERVSMLLNKSLEFYPFLSMQTR